tara:strand:- start:106 stop:228 length:123 start_codon:yes stop_codon:yes gene_type:complete
MQINILRETTDKEVTIYYAWMKDDLFMNHFSIVLLLLKGI